MPNSISRRSTLGLLGAGALAGALLARVENTAEAAGTVVGAQELLSPLKVGSAFARWTVAAIHPLADGAIIMTVRAQDGHEFNLEVLARDASPFAQRPPAETGELAIYVCNGGDGWLPTQEEQGLAAMTLAQMLESNGKGARVPGLMTHSERVSEHRKALLDHGPRIDWSPELGLHAVT
jgi:hypothetical protein